MGEGLAAVADDLAEEEVLRLDGGGAFVQRVNLGVADVLLDRVVLQEAGAAEGLQRFVAQRGVRTLGADTLDDREQQVVDAVRKVGVGAGDDLGGCGVLVRGGVQVDRAQALGVCLLGHQRTTHVGVVGDGDARGGLVGHLGEVGTLDALLGVVEGVEVTGRQGGDGLGAHHHAGMLDDLEHLRDALVDLADEPALGGDAVLTEGDLTGGRRLDAHLVFDVGDEDAVAFAQFAGLVVEVELGDEEQRQSLGAGAGALGTGEHQVEDVLGHVLVTGGDEALHAVDVPGAVGLLDGLGAAGADVGTGVGLGEDHGGAPAALGADGGPLLLLVGGLIEEDVGKAGTGCVHVERRVGAEDHFTEGPEQGARGGQAVEFFVQSDLVPACFDVGGVGLLEAFGDGHRMGLGVEHRRVAVGIGERFGDGTFGQGADLAQHVDGGLFVEVAEIAFFEDLLQVEEFEEVELEITQVALVVTHCLVPIWGVAFFAGQKRGVVSCPGRSGNRKLLASNFSLLPICICNKWHVCDRADSAKNIFGAVRTALHGVAADLRRRPVRGGRILSGDQRCSRR